MLIIQIHEFKTLKKKRLISIYSKLWNCMIDILTTLFPVDNFKNLLLCICVPPRITTTEKFSQMKKPTS